MQPFIVKSASLVTVGALSFIVGAETFHAIECDVDPSLVQLRQDCRFEKLLALEPHLEHNSTVGSPTFVNSFR